MDSSSLKLKALGWSNWFEQRAECLPADSIARVAAVDRDQLLLIDRNGHFRAKLTGRFLHRHDQSHELPCVGDWVCVKKQPKDDLGLIQSVIPRKTYLRRKAAGKSIEFQMIAANVDNVFIVQSCHYDFNVKRLERYLVMVWDGGAKPYILLTKTDLVDPAVLDSQLSEIRSAGISIPIVSLSNVTQKGISDLRQFLLPGTTSCFVGSSGVGKSTLINHLIGSELLETSSVSGTGEGTHTTVRRELIVMESGGLVIDNPGMRELGILGAEDGMSESFAEIDSLASNCRYRDCTHVREPGCAVIEAVKIGDISQGHYEHYLKLQEESKFNQLSYVEKRKKDRDFGKFIKSAKKNLHHKS